MIETIPTTWAWPGCSSTSTAGRPPRKSSLRRDEGSLPLGRAGPDRSWPRAARAGSPPPSWRPSRVQVCLHEGDRPAVIHSVILVAAAVNSTRDYVRGLPRHCSRSRTRITTRPVLQASIIGRHARLMPPATRDKPISSVLRVCGIGSRRYSVGGRRVRRRRMWLSHNRPRAGTP